MKKKPWGSFNCGTKMKGFVKNLRSGKFTASSKSQSPYIYIPANDSSIIQWIDFLLQPLDRNHVQKYIELIFAHIFI